MSNFLTLASISFNFSYFPCVFFFLCIHLLSQKLWRLLKFTLLLIWQVSFLQIFIQTHTHLTRVLPGRKTPGQKYGWFITGISHTYSLYSDSHKVMWWGLDDTCAYNWVCHGEGPPKFRDSENWHICTSFQRDYFLLSNVGERGRGLEVYNAECRARSPGREKKGFPLNYCETSLEG